MNIVYLLPFLIIINQMKLIKSFCSLQQNCTDVTKPECRPTQATNESTFPMTTNETLLALCPSYKAGEEVCCSETQLQALEGNLFALDEVFGSPGQGCDICAVNLKKFWCEFTCSPNQKNFLHVIGASNHTVGKNDTRLLTDINLDVEEETMCELFQSCKKTKFTSQVPAMGNSLGFLNFQGVNAYQKISVFIYLNQSKNSGIQFKNNKCYEEPDEKGYVGGYKIKETCKCGTCEEKCDYHFVSETPVLEGLSIKTLSIVYGVTVFITLILVWYKIKYKGGIDVLEDLEDIKEE